MGGVTRRKLQTPGTTEEHKRVGGVLDRLHTIQWVGGGGHGVSWCVHANGAVSLGLDTAYTLREHYETRWSLSERLREYDHASGGILYTCGLPHSSQPDQQLVRCCVVTLAGLPHRGTGEYREYREYTRELLYVSHVHPYVFHELRKTLNQNGSRGT